MEVTIKSKTQEPLLHRTQVKASVKFDASTPSYAELTTALASHLKSSDNLVAIRHVYTAFGEKKADVMAYVYSDEEKKKFIEPKLKEKKDKKAAAPAK